MDLTLMRGGVQRLFWIKFVYDKALITWSQELVYPNVLIILRQFIFWYLYVLDSVDLDKLQPTTKSTKDLQLSITCALFRGGPS